MDAPDPTLGGCGGDDSDDAGDRSAADADAAAETGAPGGEASGDGDAAGGSGDLPACPDVAAIGDAVGVGLVVDEASPASAEGFCPYTDSTGEVTLSLTFTDVDITQDPGAGSVEVPGLGERAIWNDTGELTVWTGSQGLVVNIFVFGHPEIDDQAAATAAARASGLDV